MNESHNLRAWIVRAEEDYTLARLALRRETPLTYGATFHAQQCAEKYLKAILVAYGRAFPKTHDLVALSDLCTRAGILLGIDLDLLNILSSYAVRVLYPGSDPTLEEAKHALEIATVVRRVARELFGL